MPLREKICPYVGLFTDTIKTYIIPFFPPSEFLLSNNNVFLFGHNYLGVNNFEACRRFTLGTDFRQGGDTNNFQKPSQGYKV